MKSPIIRQLPVIGLLILLVACQFFNLFQNIFHITEPEEIALVILLLTAILWISELLPLHITSFGVLLLSVLWLLPSLEAAGIEANKEDFFLTFFGDITLLFMGGFVLSVMLNKYGLARLMANWILRRTGSKPANVLLGIILVSSVLSMWMSNTATAAMMFAIIGPLVIQLPETSAYAKSLAIAIPFACNLGGLGTPIGTPPNAIAIEYLNQIGIQVSFIDWMLISIPVMSILIFLLWKLLLRIYPPGKLVLDLDLNDFGNRFSKHQYLVIGIFLLTVIGWLTSGLTGLTTGMVGLMVVIVTFGLNILGRTDFRSISWDILFMLGGGLCLGVALKKSGLTETIAGLIPMEGSFGIALVVLVLVAALMTSFMSNTATANLLIPVAISLAQNELLLVVAISMMCSSSMALPVSTPPNAIAFSSGMLKVKDMLISGSVVTFLALGAILLASFFYFPLFF